MARPSRLKPEELDMNTLFKIEIINWGVYQKKVKEYEWIQLRAMRPSDTLLEENLSTRGLFFDLLRFSAAGRKHGWVVAGNNEFLNLSRLARYLWVDVLELMEPLKRLIETNRIKLVTPTEEGEPEQETKQEDDISDEISDAEDMESRIYGEGRKQEQPQQPYKYHLTNNELIFNQYWQDLYNDFTQGRCYVQGSKDDEHIRYIVNSADFETILQYTYWFFHGHDHTQWPVNNMGLTIGALRQAMPKFGVEARGEQWNLASKDTKEFLMKLKKKKPQLFKITQSASKTS